MEQIVESYTGYTVSDDGKVYSTKWGRKIELKQSEHKGYRRVALSQNNKRRIYQVHQLVARAFIPNPDYKPFVNHIDGNKRNNQVSNLEWCTGKENARHAYDELNIRNGKTGYMYAKLYPNEELRNRLVELGVPRYRHNLAELGKMLPDWCESGRNTHNGKKLQHWYCDASECESLPLSGRERNKLPTIWATTEANARAKMLIYLLENKLISPKEEDNK